MPLGLFALALFFIGSHFSLGQPQTMIFLPLPPKYLGLQECTTTPGWDWVIYWLLRVRHRKTIRGPHRVKMAPWEVRGKGLHCFLLLSFHCNFQYHFIIHFRMFFKLMREMCHLSLYNLSGIVCDTQKRNR
jgi:hypothetical protein